jgi:hypothetical protein
MSTSSRIDRPHLPGRRRGRPDDRASLIAGSALSTTSLAVVYALLVETGLVATRVGKLMLSAIVPTAIAQRWSRPTWTWSAPPRAPRRVAVTDKRSHHGQDSRALRATDGP